MSNKYVDSHIDYIFDVGNTLLCNNKEEELNKILYNTDIENTHNAYLMAWLTVTHCIKHKLRYRETFFKKCEEKIGSKTLEGLE